MHIYNILIFYLLVKHMGLSSPLNLSVESIALCFNDLCPIYLSVYVIYLSLSINPSNSAVCIYLSNYHGKLHMAVSRFLQCWLIFHSSSFLWILLCTRDKTLKKVAEFSHHLWRSAQGPHIFPHPSDKWTFHEWGLCALGGIVALSFTWDATEWKGPLIFTTWQLPFNCRRPRLFCACCKSLTNICFKGTHRGNAFTLW